MEKTLEKPFAEKKPQTIQPPNGVQRVKVLLKNARVLAGERREVGTVIGEMTLRGPFSAGHIEKAILAGDASFDLG